MSGDYQINALLSGEKWNTTTVSFSFFNSGSYYGSESVSSVSDATKANVRYILSNIIQPLINVNFSEVLDSPTNYGQLRYMLSNSAGYAYAYYPGESNISGDVHLNPDYDNNSNTNGFQGGVGTHGFMTLIHETLHALGLKHSFNDGDSTTSTYLPSGEDNTTNTVMTYNFTGNSASSLMPYDIKALQSLYGARSYNAGNTTYTFDTVYGYSDGTQYKGSATKATKICLWDSGGIDTVDFSRLNSNDSYRMDLRSGGMITTNSAYNATSYTAFDDSSDTTYYTTTFGTAIAYGVIIENAIGSGGSNTIIGNDAANNFDGGAGNDNLQGGLGNDTLIGGAGNDTLDGGGGTDTASYQKATSGVTINLVNGTALDGQGGTDSLFNIEAVIGSNYNDSFTGGSGNDSFTAGSGNDFLNGGVGRDVLNGGAGNDILVGGVGNDILNGGVGSDKFVFNNVLDGIDFIKDFSRIDGDKIQINSLSFGATLANLNLFNYDTITGNLNFNGNQFATLNTNSGFNVFSDILFV